MSVQQEQQILKGRKQPPVPNFGRQLSHSNGPNSPDPAKSVRRTGALSPKYLSSANNNVAASSSNKCQYLTQCPRELYNPYNIIQYEEPKQQHGSQQRHIAPYNLHGPNSVGAAGASSSSTSSSNSTVDSMVLVKESTLGALTKQLTSSLTKMKEIEEQVKIIPELKQRLDYLINNYSEDDQTLPPNSRGAASNELVNLNRHSTRPLAPVSHEHSRKRDVTSGLVNRQKFDARRNASSSCDYNHSRDQHNIATRGNEINDTCSLGSLKLDNRSNTVDSIKNSKLDRTMPARASSIDVDYDDIINDLFSLFDSFELQSPLPDNGHKGGRASQLERKSVSPLQAKLPKRMEMGPHSKYSGSASLPLLPGNRDTFTSQEGPGLLGLIKPMPKAVNTTSPCGYSMTQNRFKAQSGQKNWSIGKTESSSTSRGGDFKTCLTINSTNNGRREAETQTIPESNRSLEYATKLAPIKADLSTNTDLLMNDLITRKQLNDLLQNLKLTPKQTMKCLMICNRTGKESKQEATHPVNGNKKAARIIKNQMQSESTDDSDDQTLSGGDTYSICSSHEDLSGFEGYFNGTKCRSVRDDFYLVDPTIDIMAQVT